MKDWQLNKGSSVLKQFDCRPQQQRCTLRVKVLVFVPYRTFGWKFTCVPTPPPPVGLHAGEWTLLSCIHCGLGYLVVRFVSRWSKKEKIVAAGRDWKCSKCSSWVVGAGGGALLQPVKRQKRKYCCWSALPPPWHRYPHTVSDSAAPESSKLRSLLPRRAAAIRCCCGSLNLINRLICRLFSIERLFE